jgi:hypothetical protein
MWNGQTFEALGAGLTYSGAIPPGLPVVWCSGIDFRGHIWFGGGFDTANGNFIGNNDRVAIWDGTTFIPLGIDLPGAPTTIISVAHWGRYQYFGFLDAGNAIITDLSTIITLGNEESFPVITITGPGTLRRIHNETTGVELNFNLLILDGETITIDLSPGVKTITSSGAPVIPLPPGLPPRPLPPRRPMAGLMLSQSDLGTWSLWPEPVAANGENIISVKIDNSTVNTSVVMAYYDRWLDIDTAIA